MIKDADDDLRQARAVDGEITPGAARDTAKRTEAAAERDHGRAGSIDQNDPAALRRWADRHGVDVDAVRTAGVSMGPDREAVALRLCSPRGAAD